MNDRFVAHLADEIATILDHQPEGGSFAGLVEHLQIRFGSVTENDVHRALGVLQAEGLFQ